MCRLFGQISIAPQKADHFLVDAPFSLLKQSDCNSKGLQRDGWGVACHESPPAHGSWSLTRSSRPLYKEKSRFLALAKHIQCPLVLAHIRRASNPDKLPRSHLIGIRHNQPFLYKNLVFVHNGTLNIQTEVAKTLGKYRRLIAGNNDSEVLFLLLAKIWEESQRDLNRETDWIKIFVDLRVELRRIWDTIPVNKRKRANFANGLNIVASDGRTMSAQCSYIGSGGGSHCDPKKPYFEMCYNKTQNRIVIASEPMDRSSSWRRLQNGVLLVVKPRGMSLIARTTRIHD